MIAQIPGYCPMGCGESLTYIRGQVRCRATDCPDPLAVHKILGNPETEHVVIFTDEHFTVMHPLRERLAEDSLFDCTLAQKLADLGGPPVPPGRYRATKHVPDGYSESYRSDDIGWDFDRLDPASANDS